MYTIEGICDWCKQPGMLTRHQYVDGKSHCSCHHCNDLAKLDVRMFNQAELEQRQQEQSASMK
ncbi:hypothetical protein [Vibrio sp. SCSIO 43136]|uniref:hypothetical protein n=1 Tax=Vibrio sp. SCSIO 43136 TaxID=2819101 RepID=UPI00207626FA|nr:hypothetical protein [Vibrio sp. SCSIO 43136]USD64129.1 hypothetical protein J4N39_08360 [Vibrio sp. SCSIO 43136]